MQVHFRGYPSEILSPCEGEDSVKWSYMNALKEATFIITGNSKSVMNMSQADQVALWESVMKGTLQAETTTFDLSDVSQCRISTAIVLFVIR